MILGYPGVLGRRVHEPSARAGVIFIIGTTEVWKTIAIISPFIVRNFLVILRDPGALVRRVHAPSARAGFFFNKWD